MRTAAPSAPGVVDHAHGHRVPLRWAGLRPGSCCTAARGRRRAGRRSGPPPEGVRERTDSMKFARWWSVSLYSAGGAKRSSRARAQLALRLRVLRPVVLENASCIGLGKVLMRVARAPRRAAGWSERSRRPADAEDALRADEAEALSPPPAPSAKFTLSESVNSGCARASSGSRRAPSSTSGGVAPVLPVAQTRRWPSRAWADRSRDEVQAGEEVDEQVAGHARAVVVVVAPAEEPHRARRAAAARGPGSGPSRRSRARRPAESCTARRRSPSCGSTTLRRGSARRWRPPPAAPSPSCRRSSYALAAHLDDAAGALLRLHQPPALCSTVCTIGFST